MAGQKKRPLKKAMTQKATLAQRPRSGGSELFVSKKTSINGNDGNNRHLIGDALFFFFIIRPESTSNDHHNSCADNPTPHLTPSPPTAD